MTMFLNFSFIAAVCALVGFVLYLFLADDKSFPKGRLLTPENKQITDMGRNLYMSHCSACHGRNLEGEVDDWQSPDVNGKLPAPPHDQTGHTWHHDDQLLFNITKFGMAKAANLEGYESAMPAYEKFLSDAEIIAILTFIKSTWPKHLQASHDQLNTHIDD